MGDLGLNPRTLRDQASLVRGQLSHLESIAKQLANSRNAARNPASWGLDADDRAIDPAYVGSALTAYNDIIGAVASGRAPCSSATPLPSEVGLSGLTWARSFRSR